jgi:hypothetical protein
MLDRQIRRPIDGDKVKGHSNNAGAEQKPSEKSQADNSPFVLVRSKAQIRTRRKPAHIMIRNGSEGEMDGPGPGSLVCFPVFSAKCANARWHNQLDSSVQPNPGSSSVVGPTGNGGTSSNPNPAFNIAQAISSLSSSASNWTALSSAYIKCAKISGLQSKRDCTGGCARKWWVV